MPEQETASLIHRDIPGHEQILAPAAILEFADDLRVADAHSPSLAAQWYSAAAGSHQPRFGRPVHACPRPGALLASAS